MMKQSKTTTTKTSSKSYKDHIIEALIELNSGRKGLSRIALKKFVRDKNPNLSNNNNNNNNFDHFFNLAIKKGVADGTFEQPNGPSGTIKLVEKPISPSPSSSTKKLPKKISKKTSPSSPLPHTPTTITARNTTKAPKKITKKTNTSSSSSSYKTMIIKGVVALNNGKGSSRLALKNFVKDLYIKNSGGKAPPSNFDYNFNKSIRKAVEDGYLSQPRGPSGLVKILKKGKIFVSAA